MHRMISLMSLVVVVSMAGIAEAQRAVPLPKVTGPVPSTAASHPFLAATHDLPVIDLAKFGYVEEEFFLSGGANVYNWAADGTVSTKILGAPYTTRILVRRPSNPSRFSGTVVVEPLFSARRWDWSMMWGYTHDYLLDHGDAWVGITMPGSVAGLQFFDAMRYASLSFKNPAPDEPCPAARGGTAAAIEEGLRWDVMSQVAALLKRSNAAVPLGGSRAAAVFLTMQGGDLTTYIAAIHPRAGAGAPLFDGFVSKAPFNLSRISQCAPVPAANDPRQALKDVGVPVIAVAAEGEVLATHPWRRADSDEPRDRYRLYEVSGAGHIDKSAYIGFPSMQDQATAGNAQGSAAWPFAAPCDPDIPLMDTPIMSVAFNAAFSHLDAWVRKGTPPPHAARLEISDPGTPQARIVADEFGHGRGGFRTPFVEVPRVTYVTNSPGPGNCREMAHAVPFERARLESLYPDAKAYAAKVNQSVDRLLKERWLTDVDARRIKAELTANPRPLIPNP